MSESDSEALSPHIVFVVNQGSFLLSHRWPLVAEAIARDMRVTIICGDNTGGDSLRTLGVSVHTIALSRSGFNPFEEFRSFRALVALYRELRPDIVHHVTIKPVIYGTQAARIAGVPGVVNAIPGMGFVFTRRGRLARVRRLVVSLLYRVALSHPNMRVIFQNSEDMEVFLGPHIVSRPISHLIRGSGVDLDAFPFSVEPEGDPVFLLVGRMLRHKGVGEFVSAARELKHRFPGWRFQLVGDVDVGNPSSLAAEDLRAWNDSGEVEWLGPRSDVADLLRQANVVCLPSYREGLPKTLLEASSVGRAMIVSDVAGCLEVVRDGVNGLVVPVRDATSLQDAMRRLGSNPEQRRRFGEAARNKAEAVFGVDDVVRDTFLIYEQVLSQ